MDIFDIYYEAKRRSGRYFTAEEFERENPDAVHILNITHTDAEKPSYRIYLMKDGINCAVLFLNDMDETPSRYGVSYVSQDTLSKLESDVWHTYHFVEQKE